MVGKSFKDESMEEIRAVTRFLVPDSEVERVRLLGCRLRGC
jgi:hypothetical protein